MAVFYKMRCLAGYSKINIDGSYISVEDLKVEIMQQERLGKSGDFALQIINPETKEVYEDDKFLINKNTSVWYARAPIQVTRRGPKKWKAPGNDNKDDGDIQSKKLQRSQVGEVPENYLCYKCHQRGHWIKNCPLGPNRASIKRSSGIPKTFMVPVKGPEVAGAMITAIGTYAIPAMNQEMYITKEVPSKVSSLKIEADKTIKFDDVKKEGQVLIGPKIADIKSKPVDLVGLKDVADTKFETNAIPKINRGFCKFGEDNKENCKYKVTYVTPPPDFVVQSNYTMNYQDQHYRMNVQTQPPSMMYNQQKYHAPMYWGNQQGTNEMSSTRNKMNRVDEYNHNIKVRRDSQPSRKRNRSRSRSPGRYSSSSSSCREDYRERRPSKRSYREYRQRY